MQITGKTVYPLKNSNTFVVLEVKGRRGEQINLAEQGLNGLVIFFHEAPKSNINCSYLTGENAVELGGIERETERTIYLIFGPAGAKRDENKAYSEKRL